MNQEFPMRAISFIISVFLFHFLLYTPYVIAKGGGGTSGSSHSSDSSHSSSDSSSSSHSSGSFYSPSRNSNYYSENTHWVWWYYDQYGNRTCGNICIVTFSLVGLIMLGVILCSIYRCIEISRESKRRRKEQSALPYSI